MREEKTFFPCLIIGIILSVAFFAYQLAPQMTTFMGFWIHLVHIIIFGFGFGHVVAFGLFYMVNFVGGIGDYLKDSRLNHGQ